MKVLITGSRDWPHNRRYIVHRAILAAEADIVIHGNARGADGIAKWFARHMGITERGYDAKWGLYGKSAGPIRNQEMLDKEHRPDEPIDLVLAFPLPGSIGTYDMMRRAEAAGIRIVGA